MPSDIDSHFWLRLYIARDKAWGRFSVCAPLSSLTFNQRGYVGLDFCSCPVYFREAISLRLVQNGSITQGYRCDHATRARWNTAIARNPIYNLLFAIAHFQYDPNNFGRDIASAFKRWSTNVFHLLINRQSRLFINSVRMENLIFWYIYFIKMCLNYEYLHY